MEEVGEVSRRLLSAGIGELRKEGGNATCWVRERRLVQYTSVVIVVQQVNLQQRPPNSWSPHLLLAYLVVMTKPLSPAQELDLLCLPTPSSQSPSSEPPTLGGSQMVSNVSVDASLGAHLVFHAVYHGSSLRHGQQLAPPRASRMRIQLSTVFFMSARLLVTGGRRLGGGTGGRRCGVVMQHIRSQGSSSAEPEVQKPVLPILRLEGGFM